MHIKFSEFRKSNKFAFTNYILRHAYHMENLLKFSEKNCYDENLKISSKICR